MLKFAVFAGLFILLIATSGCLEGPAGPAGTDGVDGKDGVSGFEFDTVVTCPCQPDSLGLFYVDPGVVPSHWIVMLYHQEPNSEGVMESKIFDRITSFVLNKGWRFSFYGFEVEKVHIFYNL